VSEWVVGGDLRDNTGYPWFRPRRRLGLHERARLLQVVCTDREQHRITRLAASLFTDDGTWYETLTHGDSFGVYCSDPDWDGESESDALYVEFRCTRCARRPRVTLTRWQMLMDGLDWRPGVSDLELDISALPF
jgi:hypothetical protein